MFEELTGIETPGIVVLVSVDDYDMPQIFMKNRNLYINKLRKIIDENTINTSTNVDPDGGSAS